MRECACVPRRQGTAPSFFTSRTGLFDARPAVWQHMTEEERRELCACFDALSGEWTVENVRAVMSLGFVRLDDITTLRGCWLVTKEDQSAFVDPVYPIDPEPEKSPSTKRQ